MSRTKVTDWDPRIAARLAQCSRCGSAVHAECQLEDPGRLCLACMVETGYGAALPKPKPKPKPSDSGASDATAKPPSITDLLMAP